MKKLLLLCLVVGFLSCLGIDTATAASKIAIIVNSQNPTASLSIEDLRKIYYGKTTKWQDGVKIAPYELKGGSDEREEFAQMVFNATGEAVDREYVKMELSGNTVPPTILDTPEEMLNVVSSSINAIGYIEASQIMGNEAIKAITISAAKGASEEINVLISGAFSSKASLPHYEKLLAYIAKKTGNSIKTTSGMSYEIGCKLLQSGKAQIGFLSGYTYLRKKDVLGLELLAAPVMSNAKYGGAPKYFSYVIVPLDSQAKTFADLKEKKYLFSEPLSNSGYNIPRYELAKMGQKITGFFKEASFSGSHEKSIEMVADKLADGASVSSLIWDADNAISSGYTSKTKIIAEHASGAAPVIAVLKKSPEATKAALKDALLKMAEDPEGKAILDKLLISRFSEVSEEDYSEIAEMEKTGLDFEKNN